MDSSRFDQMTRQLATAQTRRRALGALAAAGTVVLGGVTGVGAAPEAEGNKCQDKPCNKNKNCGRGLVCNLDGRCEYKRGNKGKKNDTCCKNKECEKGLRCDKNKCVNK